MTRLRKVLLIAFHFPPLAGSSGVQRTLRLAQHLPALGWQPTVLTVVPSAYERTSDDLLHEVPQGVTVHRALGLDAARQLSLRGRYLGATARPDRWATWRFDAVRRGMKLVNTLSPDVLWSTYPIATAHVIAAQLQARTRVPWVADFRDPMAQPGYPADPKVHASYLAIESTAMQRAFACTFTTPSAAATYQARYADAKASVHVIENGYDEASFASIDTAELAERGPLNPGKVTLLHSGIVYPSERDPSQLMAALRLLHDAGTIHPDRLRLRFRAAVADALLHRLAAEHGVQDYIETLAPIPYAQALAEMMRADGLMVMQAANCNEQIPAKLYEYLRAGRPMLALADPAGDTAKALQRAGVQHGAALESGPNIASALGAFLMALVQGRLAPLDAAHVRAASREARSAAFAQVFDAAARLRA
jgi:glycosyltransferase involved in cell wall biosynthesis